MGHLHTEDTHSPYAADIPQDTTSFPYTNSRKPHIRFALSDSRHPGSPGTDRRHSHVWQKPKEMNLDHHARGFLSMRTDAGARQL